MSIDPSQTNSSTAPRASAASSSINVRGAGVRRGETWILRNINWSVPPAACAAVLGPNGSGKSTLARILACHLWPTEGSVSVLGNQLGDANLPAVRQQIRLIQPAGPYDVDPELSSLEVVQTGFFGTIGLYDRVTDPMRAHALELLERVGLGRASGRPYRALSSGERVRALIARALVVRPGLLLLDEPTAGLDLLAREQVLGVVQRLFDDHEKDGTVPAPPTTIIITHHVEELPPATTSVLLLDNGAAAAMGTPQEVLQSETLSRVYGCPVEVRRSNGRFYLEVRPSAWEGMLE